jgi:clan AA aspartic protease
MITGTVSANREPVIQIHVLGAAGQEVERSAIVDTGFNGWLTLPSDLVAALGLSWKRSGTAILADGSLSYFDVYEAVLIWDGQAINVPADEADSDPLVGMALMRGYKITIEDVDGGAVTIEALNP